MGRAGGSCGVVRGRLVGGNLSLLVSLLGTSWQVGLRGAVLVLEDVNEAPYRLDRMWTHLTAAGLDGLAALVLGEFGNPKGAACARHAAARSCVGSPSFLPHGACCCVQRLWETRLQV